MEQKLMKLKAKKKKKVKKIIKQIACSVTNIYKTDHPLPKEKEETNYLYLE